MKWQLDHLAVAAATLEEGAEWVADRLGVAPGFGGQHPQMGTHNRLLSIGPGIYLEVIAIDPEASPPGRPRWFDLDRFDGPPRLVAWVVRTDDLDAAIGVAPEGSGEPIAFSRGPYRWRMAVPADGRLPFDGTAPALISWSGDMHPAEALPPTRVRLARLDVTHPTPLAGQLPAVEGVRFVAGTPGLRAFFHTPEGERELS